jgi:hypothetical protein
LVSHIKSRNAHTLFSPIYFRHSYTNITVNLTFNFVHDLAGALYSIETIALMKNLPFVNNTTNPQNVPQVRLKENLRGILAQKV